MAWQKLGLVGLGSFVVLGSLMVPAFGGSPQTLAGQSAATGIAGDLGKRSGANVLGAADKAKGVAAKANAQVKENNALLEDSETKPSERRGLNIDVLDAGSFLKQFSSDKNAEKNLVGKFVKAQGIVLHYNVDNGHTLVALGPPNGSKKGPIFVFRFPGTDKAFEVGRPATMEGSFAFRNLDEQSGIMMYYLDTESQTTAGGPVAPASGPAEPALPFAGWRFCGSVQADGGGTGVFERDGKTVYAQAGDELEGGVKVKSVGTGIAVLKDGDEPKTVMAW